MSLNQDDSYRIANLLRQDVNSDGILSDNPLIMCDMVDNLGGIRAIVDLCLNNEDYRTKHIKNDNIKHIINLLSTITGENVNNKINNQKDKENDSVNNKQLEIDEDIIITSDNHNDNPSNDNYYNQVQNDNCINNNSDCKLSKTIEKPERSNFSRNIKDDLIYDVDCQNSLLFKYLSYNYANTLYYKMLLNVKFQTVFCIFVVLMMIIESLIDEFTSNNVTVETIADIMQILTFVVGFVVCVAYISSVNIDVFSMIMHSFDFWYKMINLMLCMISLSWMVLRMPTQQEKSYIGDFGGVLVWAQISFFTMFTMICLSDAILFTVKVRQFFSSGIALSLVWFAISIFFNVNENESYLNWNPFSMYKNGIGKYTNINCKSLALSSLSNLMLFLLKPSFSNIGKKTKKCLCQAVKKKPSKQGNNYNVNSTSGNKYLMQSTSVYKKPYFQWKNVNISHDQNNDDESKEQELGVSIGNFQLRARASKQASNITLNGKHGVLVGMESPKVVD